MDVKILAECSLKRFYFYRFNLQIVSIVRDPQVPIYYPNSQPGLMIPHLFNFNLNPFGTKTSCTERISKFSVLEICQRIGKISSKKLIFPSGLVTMATTLSKTYTTKILDCCSIQKTVLVPQ